MVSTLLLCSGLMLAAAPTRADRADYEAARVQVGRDPEAHVKLALWCEQHGLSAERAKHLALAVLNDPTNAVARGLMGLVKYQGGWRRPEDVTVKLKGDPERTAKFAQYAAKRAKAPHTADGQWKLALWCEENGMKTEAMAHFSATVRYDPNHESARKRLGYKKHEGRWVTEAQLAAEKAAGEAQRKADRHWKPRLAKWRDALGEKVKRDAAARSLEGVTDPGAVPSIWDVFAGGSETNQARAVQLFGQINSPGASRALATLAVSSRSSNVRRVATETLRRRDSREFVGLLIALVHRPLKYEVRAGSTPWQTGELFVEGARYNVKRVYQMPRFASSSMIIPSRMFGDLIPFEPFSPQNLWLASLPPYIPVTSPASPHHGGAAQPAAANELVPNATVAAAQRDVQIGLILATAQQLLNLGRQQLMDDVATVEALNADIRQVNSQVLPVLSAVTGQDLGDSEDAWQVWWNDQRGLVYDVPSSDSKPTVTEIVLNPAFSSFSCFGIGTSVRTLDGEQRIESIRTGDQVLTQDARTGALSFEPVVAIFHNKPAPSLKLTLGDETVVVTGIHRFWKAGHGWVMARDLKTGDSVRTLGGVASVSAIEDAPVQPVFNLEVASGQSFFVGKQGALVHDNSLVRPVSEPFDAPPKLETAIAE